MAARRRAFFLVVLFHLVFVRGRLRAEISDIMPARPLFAAAGTSIALSPEYARPGPEVILRSRRLGLAVKTSVRLRENLLFLDIPADVPPDYYDIMPLGEGGGSGEAKALGAVKILRGDGSVIRLVHVTDLHYDESSQKSQALAEMVRLITLLDPDVVLFGGDVMTEPSEAGFAAVMEAFGRIPAPVFPSPGNHDHRDMRLYQKYFTPLRRYSFNAGAWHIISLDSGKMDFLLSHRGEGLEKDKLTWLEADMAASTGPILIFIHHSPVPGSHSFDGAEDDFLDAVLRAGVKAVLSGHVHRDEIFDLADSYRALNDWKTGSLPAIHTTTLGSSRLRGAYAGLRLMLLETGGRFDASPFLSIPLRGLKVECDEGASGASCRLTNSTQTTVPGVRFETAFDPPAGMNVKILWRRGGGGGSFLIDAAPGEHTFTVN